MKGFAAVILAAGLVLSAPTAAADDKDFSTQRWLRLCDETDAMFEGRDFDLHDLGACSGFIDGYLQASWVLLPALGHEMFCGPAKGVSIYQAHQIWKRFMEQHPEDLHLPAIQTLQWSMYNAFPCPKG